MSGFVLDRFEVTVGRFRKFVEAYPGSKPAAGAGRHPRIEGSGWDAGWDSDLPADAEALKAAVKCDATYQTWTDEAGDHEHLPMNCLSWYVAFAFCAWDGGRLPTETEWNYAAAGGEELRWYPWSTPAGSSTIDGSYAVYDCMGDGSMPQSCASSDIQPVGSRSTQGDGKWGQADLAGSLWEWVLDGQDDDPPECVDCAKLANTARRMARGGSWDNGAMLLTTIFRAAGAPSTRVKNFGVRCARTP